MPVEMEVEPSSWVEQNVFIKGKPFSFDERDYLKPIYDSPWPKRLLKCGRQVEKSSTLCNVLVQEAACSAYTNSLYVSSSQTQTSVFSTAYIKQTLVDSPALMGSFYKPGNGMYIDKIYEKQFTNNSRIYFRYAFLTADRVRGVSARDLNLDELQDILIKNVPIMEQCTQHFMATRRWFYSGTPKTYENAMEVYWKRSTQREWVVKCDACNFWNVLGERNMQEKGLSCEKCGRLINPKNGQWAHFGKDDAEFDGFRISQLMVPWVVWREIWLNYKNYPRAQFYNEVLGLSCERSSALLSQMDLIRACSAANFPMYMTRPADRYYQSLHAGVDWGAGQGSMTVHVIGGMRDGRFEVIYMRKYDPSKQDTAEIVADIAKVNYVFKVMRCGADWGFGFMQNQELQKAHRTIPVLKFYSSATQKAMVNYNRKTDLFTINRNSVISNLINGIKKGTVLFFRWREFEAFSKDFLGLFNDYRLDTRVMYFNHPADCPDDAVHATNYARTCAFMYARILRPGHAEQ